MIWKGLYSILVVIITRICYAVNVNFIKTKLVEVNSVNITSFGFIDYLPGIYLFTSDLAHIMKTDEQAWMSLFYISLLAIFGTAMAVILFNMLIKRVSAIFASSTTYIIPVFAIFSGILDGENIQLMQFVSIAVILTGVIYSQQRQ